MRMLATNMSLLFIRFTVQCVQAAANSIRNVLNAHIKHISSQKIIITLVVSNIYRIQRDPGFVQAPTQKSNQNSA